MNAGKDVNPELIAYAESKGLPVLVNPGDEDLCQAYEAFYDKIFEDNAE